ncbi:hypothetical protein AVEN_171559-1 [Araneus ventricosus]|uniref:Tc1-like transposase DDE domain-containing protein n=1 Tax=Araneus ventricosus TaxID=182803 RepID=A0A4Y2JYG1_ARAVE|nr:hypothetical protein AVEN_171559-1 [Araneus ventricosus]
MWCSIFRNSLVGPIFSLNGDRFMQLVLNGTVSGLMDELPLAFLSHVWFQLDGAPPHHTSAARRWFNAELPDKWIDLQGPVEFLPKSLDMMALDFSLWGRLRSSVYNTPPVDLADLCRRIQKA